MTSTGREAPRRRAEAPDRVLTIPRAQVHRFLTILSLQFYILSISHNFARIPGAFAYIEASGKPPGLYTDLDLPPLEESPVYCLRFWYNMNGPDIGQLQVVVDDGTGETIMFDETKQGGA